MARWSTDKGLDPDDAARRAEGSDYDEPFLPRGDPPDRTWWVLLCVWVVIGGLVAVMWWVVR